MSVGIPACFVNVVLTLVRMRYNVALSLSAKSFGHPRADLFQLVFTTGPAHRRLLVFW